MARTDFRSPTGKNGCPHCEVIIAITPTLAFTSPPNGLCENGPSRSLNCRWASGSFHSEAQQDRIGQLQRTVDALRESESFERYAAIRQSAWEQQLRKQPAELSPAVRDGLVAHFPFDEIQGQKASNLVAAAAESVFYGTAPPCGLRGWSKTQSTCRATGVTSTLGIAFSPERTDPFSYGCWFLAIPDGRRGTLFGKFNNQDQCGFAVSIDPENSDVVCEWSHRCPENSLIVRARCGVGGQVAASVCDLQRQFVRCRGNGLSGRTSGGAASGIGSSLREHSHGGRDRFK